LRLLVDEMYPAAIAAQLRRRGRDAVAVTEHSELRSLSDPDLFTYAQEARRALLTENIADFAVIADAADERALAHYGLIFVDPAKYPRGSARTIGQLVNGLEAFLAERAADDPTSLRHWL